MVVIAVMVVMGVVASAVMSVGIDTTPRTDKGRATRANKTPANMWTTKSKTSTRPNGKAPGATANAVTTKAATAKRMAAKPAATKAVTTKPTAAKPVASFRQRNRACHYHQSGRANRENVLHLFHRATRFFVLRRSRQRSTHMLSRKALLCS